MNKMNIIKKISILVLCLCAFLLVPNSKVNAFTLSTKPTAISVTYYDDIDSRGFAWQTSKSVTETRLLYVKDNGQTVNWDDAIVVKGSYEDFNEFRCHKAHITDLDGGKYFYKVGGNGTYSSVGTFTIDDSNDNKVSFTYVTDSQATSPEGFEAFDKTLKAAIKHNPDFITFAGDLVDNSHAGWGDDISKIVMEEWSYAFDTTKDVTMNYAMMSAAGNHERAGYTFVNHNNINYDKAASTGGYYSFDYENVHFAVLDTNAMESGYIDDQVEWLEKDLASTNKPWKIVMLHMGVYSTGDHSNDSISIKIRNILPPILAKYKVDLVLQGHDHVYTRTMPYLYGENETGKVANRNEKYVEEDGILWSLEPDGTYYITINSCGQKFYPPVGYDTSRIFPAKSPVNGKTMSQELKNRMFAHVEIDGDSLLLKSYISYDDGTEQLYDYIAIKKNTYVSVENAIDKLPADVKIENAFEMKNIYDSLEGLSDRALAYIPTEKVEKFYNLLADYNIDDNVAAYKAILAIEKLNVENYDEMFWTNYQAANEAYYNLTATQMEMVYNKNVLLDIKGNLENIKDQAIKNYLVQSVQGLIDSIESAEDKEKARLLAKMAYEALDEDLQSLITNTEILNQSFVPAETPEEEGCGGAIVASISSISMLALCVICIKRKRGEINE